MSNQEILNQIVEHLGGKENLATIENCMTRLRLEVKDASKVNVEAIKKVPGVLGYVEEGASKQIIVGPGKAKKLADMMKEDMMKEDMKGLAGEAAAPKEQAVGDWEKNKASLKEAQKKSKFKDALKSIGEIFIPLLPAIMAAGILNGFAGLIANLQTSGALEVSTMWETIRLLFSLIGGGFLSYFAIFTGVNAAKQFGATPAFGGMLGAMSIMPMVDDISKVFGLFNEASPLNSILRNGKGGIIGVIIGVFILAKVEKAVRKRVPDVLDLIVTPIVTLLITTVIFVFVIMPASGVLSDALVSGLNVLVNSTNPIVSIISGFVLAALFLPMVLLGLHHGLIPIYAVQLEQMGGVSLFPVLAMAGAGQVGAAIAIYIKAKRLGKSGIQQIIAGALPAGILGIGEPLIYGVTLPLGKPFITAGIGAGFGGAYIMMTDVMSTAWGPSGIVAIPLIQPASMINFLIGITIAYVGGFLVTQFFMKDTDLSKVD
ncbi:MAG: PTS transporter subunit EIIC [Cellulosilyticaceae bacterium]